MVQLKNQKIIVLVIIIMIIAVVAFAIFLNHDFENSMSKKLTYQELEIESWKVELKKCMAIDSVGNLESVRASIHSRAENLSTTLETYDFTDDQDNTITNYVDQITTCLDEKNELYSYSIKLTPQEQEVESWRLKLESCSAVDLLDDFMTLEMSVYLAGENLSTTLRTYDFTDDQRNTIANYVVQIYACFDEKRELYPNSGKLTPQEQEVEYWKLRLESCMEVDHMSDLIGVTNSVFSAKINPSIVERTYEYTEDQIDKIADYSDQTFICIDEKNELYLNSEKPTNEELVESWRLKSEICDEVNSIDDLVDLETSVYLSSRFTSTALNSSDFPGDQLFTISGYILHISTCIDEKKELYSYSKKLTPQEQEVNSWRLKSESCSAVDSIDDLTAVDMSIPLAMEKLSVLLETYDFTKDQDHAIDHYIDQITRCLGDKRELYPNPEILIFQEQKIESWRLKSEICSAVDSIDDLVAVEMSIPLAAENLSSTLETYDFTVDQLDTLQNYVDQISACLDEKNELYSTPEKPTNLEKPTPQEQDVESWKIRLEICKTIDNIDDLAVLETSVYLAAENLSEMLRDSPFALDQLDIISDYVDETFTCMDEKRESYMNP